MELIVRAIGVQVVVCVQYIIQSVVIVGFVSILVHAIWVIVIVVVHMDQGQQRVTQMVLVELQDIIVQLVRELVGVRFVISVALVVLVQTVFAVPQKLLLEHIVVVVQHDVVGVEHVKLIIQPVGVQLREFVGLVVLV